MIGKILLIALGIFIGALIICPILYILMRLEFLLFDRISEWIEKKKIERFKKNI